MTGTCPDCPDVLTTGETEILKRKIHRKKEKRIKYHTLYYVGYPSLRGQITTKGNYISSTSAVHVALNIEAHKMTRTQFEHFLLWEGVVVLKEVILNSFYFGRVWWS